MYFKNQIREKIFQNQFGFLSFVFYEAIKIWSSAIWEKFRIKGTDRSINVKNTDSIITDSRISFCPQINIFWHENQMTPPPPYIYILYDNVYTKSRAIGYSKFLATMIIRISVFRGARCHYDGKGDLDCWKFWEESSNLYSVIIYIVILN